MDSEDLFFSTIYLTILRPLSVAPIVTKMVQKMYFTPNIGLIRVTWEIVAREWETLRPKSVLCQSLIYSLMRVELLHR